MLTQGITQMSSDRRPEEAIEVLKIFTRRNVKIY